MIAKELISSAVLPLKTSDTGDQSLQIMADFYVRHLPIVNEDRVLGLLSDDDVYANHMEEPVGSYQLSIHKTSVNEKDHIFEVMSLMAEYHLTAIPVVDDDDHYMGIITMSDLMNYYASSYSFKEPGSIIVLKMNKINYSLAEISRLIEMEDGAVLSTFISHIPESVNILVTLKINRQEITRIIQTLERFEYEVYASYTESAYINNLKERYDMLISYLNM